MVYCGSGLFQVAFSSVAIFSAIYSRCLLRTYISGLQWLGIFIVTAGLVVSPLSSRSSSDSPMIGVLLTLLGAQFYALSYIVNEYITVGPLAVFEVETPREPREQGHLQVRGADQHGHLSRGGSGRHQSLFPEALRRSSAPRAADLLTAAGEERHAPRRLGKGR